MSVYQTALYGMQTQSRAMAGYAAQIAGAGAIPLQNGDSGGAPVDMVTLSPEALEHALIGMMTAKHLFTASAQIAATQSEMDATLMNILA